MTVEPVDMDSLLSRILSNVAYNYRPNFFGEIVLSVFCSPHSVDPDPNVGHRDLSFRAKARLVSCTELLQPEGWSNVASIAALLQGSMKNLNSPCVLD